MLCPIGQTPEVRTYETIEQLREDLAGELGQDQYLFVFQGRQHHLSEGPFHYLITDDGRRIPMFEMPTPEEVQPSDGYVGVLSLAADTDESEEATGEDDFVADDVEEEEDDEDPYGEEPELQVHDPDDDDEDEEG